MGSLHAQDFASAVDEGALSLDAALRWHLRSNHFPPVPTTMVEACKQAIDLANEGGWDEEVDLPEGITWRGCTTAPARALVSDLHLDSFLVWDDDYYDEGEVW